VKSALHKYGVQVCTATAKSIASEDSAVSGVVADGKLIPCKWVILATGGLSYPATGSTGDGYKIAAAFGHTVTSCEGSLVPLETVGADAQQMQGLSLRNVGVKLVNEKGKVLYKDFGELVFTHFGVSGPTVLSASAHLKGKCRLLIDLKPALMEDVLHDTSFILLETIDKLCLFCDPLLKSAEHICDFLMRNAQLVGTLAELTDM
jgi:predicted flavoprotein YhiN